MRSPVRGLLAGHPDALRMVVRDQTGGCASTEGERPSPPSGDFELPLEQRFFNVAHQEERAYSQDGVAGAARPAGGFEGAGRVWLDDHPARPVSGGRLDLFGRRSALVPRLRQVNFFSQGKEDFADLSDRLVAHRSVYKSELFGFEVI